MVKVSDKLINDMKDAIVREVDPEKIILFGSWALGLAHEQSDVDLLVIEREPFGHRRVTQAAFLTFSSEQVALEPGRIIRRN